jgi:hypothetical protein
MSTRNVIPCIAALTVALTAICLGQFVQSTSQRSETKRGAVTTPPLKPSPLSKDASAQADLPVIVHLEKRNEIITVKAGPNRPVYLVKDKSGKILFDNVSEKDLQAKAPEIHEFIRTATGKGSQKGGAKLDARISPQTSSSFLDASGR